MEEIKEINNFLKSFVIGIKFRANFILEGKLGEVVNDILYRKNAFFGPDFFPLVQHNREQIGKMLIDVEKGNSLTIDIENIILELNTFETKDLKDILNHFKTEIVEGVMKQYKISHILRVGYLKKYILSNKSMAEGFIKNRLGGLSDGTNDIVLRFSRKQTPADSMVLKDINDYYQTIFNVVKKNSNDDLYVALDFQRYFSPSCDLSDKMDFDNLIDKAEKFNSTELLSWIKGEQSAT